MSAYIKQKLRVHDTDEMPMIIVGNKADLEDRREVSTMEGKDWAKSIRANFLEGIYIYCEHEKETKSDTIV